MARIPVLLAALLLFQTLPARAESPAPRAGAGSEAAGQAAAKPRKAKARSVKQTLTKEERLAFIRRSQVWAPTNVAAMNLREGPQTTGAFPPNALVTCDYTEAKLSGTSRKFDCKLGERDVVKVRYGAKNAEVEGAVLASRLLWALGFGADRVYPVRLICRGCSSDPWTARERVPGERTFDPAAIERPPEGYEMKTAHEPGWAWPELALVDEAEGGAPPAHRDALTLLAVFMQHTDNKAEQQRLLCLGGAIGDNGQCDKPFMILHDVGLTFGAANFFNRTATASVNLALWTKTPVWRDAPACVGHLSKSSSGTLADPKISEAGRAFLADLLVQLSDEQLHDLFEVARVDLRSVKPSDSPAARATIIDRWVAAFKHKRDEIVMNHCPS